jgi:uncharacterized protein (DUF1800 family)
MTDPQTSPGTASCWAPYRPTPAAPWNLRRALHLHRRAGFAATRAELERDLRDGPEASVDRFLNGQGQTTGIPSEHEHLAQRVGDAAVDSRQPDRLEAWWVFRMLSGPDALRERLTLMWHDHFATSNRKVNDVRAMRRQYELFRRQARAPFGALLNEAVRDPALLVWLDAPANRKGHPNENLAREFLELFTLGLGHFDETDVKEAARTLTGWTVDRGEFVENAAAHDPGDKTLLGKPGRWSGADLVRIVLEHPATAHRLAGRICATFLGEGSVERADVDALSSSLRAHDLDVGWAVATVLRSEAYFAESDLGARVVGPAEFVVGAVRALECVDRPPSTLELARWIARLGQELFYPPNVGGWPGGRSWLTSRGLIARANFATALCEGKELGLPGPLDVAGLAARNGFGGGLEPTIDFLGGLLLGIEPIRAWRDRIAEAAATQQVSPAEAARRGAALIMASPEFQVV